MLAGALNRWRRAPNITSPWKPLYLTARPRPGYPGAPPPLSNTFYSRSSNRPGFLLTISSISSRYSGSHQLRDDAMMNPLRRISRLPGYRQANEHLRLDRNARAGRPRRVISLWTAVGSLAI